MVTEFDAIFGEFSSELDALAEMARSPGDMHPQASSPRARIAAGNGATLLLAATFEEYVRQQVRAAFRVKVKRARSMTDFPGKIASTVWRRSLELLARTPFEDIESDGTKTDARVAATLSFCLRREIAADVGDVLSHNQNNMRLPELKGLFKQIGVRAPRKMACRDPARVE
jgi:hypothetical protein